MTLLLVTHDTSLDHVTPRGHPERVDRVIAAVDGLRSVAAPIIDLAAPKVDRDLLELVHDREYIDEVHAFCLDGGGALDPDTHVVPGSWDAALHSAGGGPAAVDALVRSRADTAFVAMRPPGHHAEHARAMGFCLFNNVAITAAYLRGFGERVAIVDWDVHHGNGTQHTFYRDPDVLYLSLHEFPFYPGTGWVTETGAGPGTGFTVNVAVPSATANTSYLAAFARIILPIVSTYAPDWLLISAGFDAHRRDPLGGLMLESEDYRTMAASLAAIVPPRRTIAFLEGGYDLDAVATSARLAVEGTLGGDVPSLSPDDVSGSARRVTELAVEALSRHWDLDQEPRPPRR
jgi:acetoin utilization deacetylase AcuC-like enzyme